MYILTLDEIKSIRDAAADSDVHRLYGVIKRRNEINTKNPGIIQPHDTNDFRHICWNRLSDASLVAAVDGCGKTKTWLKETVLELCALPAEEWIGPWFRNRAGLSGNLETSHLSLGVCAALDLCPDIFDEDETKQIKQNLKEKGLDAIERFCVWQAQLAGLPGRDLHGINNWFAVLLNGYVAASVLLGYERGLENGKKWIYYITSMFNEDSYGESLQYANYALIHLCHMTEVLSRTGMKADELPYEVPARMMKWCAASFMGMKKGAAVWVGDAAVPQSLNFADSAIMFRPSGDILAQCARMMKDKMPREASLASYLFETCYGESELDVNTDLADRAEYGFFNGFSMHALIHREHMAQARSPYDTDMPLLNVFDNGHVIIRDEWRDNKFTLGIQGGYKSLNVAGHRHEDLNSFILSAFGEILLSDPGHCCYRTKTQGFSVSAQAHNIWVFEKNNRMYGQNLAVGNYITRKSPLARLIKAETIREAFVVSSDCAAAYGDFVKRAERTWIAFAPHILFVVDRIEFSEPAKIHTRFWGNNRDNKLKVNVAASDKLVFRRGSSAMKLFSVGDKAQTLTFDAGYTHDAYHPQPGQKGQGVEGSALGYCFTSEEGLSFVNVYAMTISEERMIKAWHIYKGGDGFVKTEGPGGSYAREIKAEPDKIIMKARDDEIWI